ncbi:MAG: TetR/AcrR family transcriptional regulator [Ilumatobacter sp.]
MGHRHTKQELLDGALAVAFANGLSQLTFGRVAKHIGINDRTVVYYFPTKHDLITEVLLAMGLRLQETLAAAFVEPARDHIELLQRAWPVVATTDADPVFALFFEANGLAASGLEPFSSVLADLVNAWIDWAELFIDDSAPDRRVEAETAIAVLDGLLLLRQLAGPGVAERAARRLGITT